MIAFPNCKINLGLNVIEKRSDGFHSINTVFYPVSWCDALEVIENQNDTKSEFTTSGIPVQGPVESNLIYKCWKLLTEIKELPPVKVHLHKNIPMGAGIGGGSSDAAFLINLADKKFSLGLSFDQKHDLCSQLGSDCAFFLDNQPVFAEERGDKFSPVNLDLKKYYILVVHPGIHSNTREAFEGLTPQYPAENIRSIIENVPVEKWKETLTNDFDLTIMKKYPVVRKLRDNLYGKGAIYASMSGSGSSVYGLFTQQPNLDFPPAFKWYLQLPVS